MPISIARVLHTAGLLASLLSIPCPAAELSIGALRLPGIEGFEQQPDRGNAVHLRNRDGVDLRVSVFSIGADAEAEKFQGDAAKRLEFLEQGARKAFEGSVGSGERVVALRHEDLPGGNILFSGAIRSKGLFRSGSFLLFLFAAPSRYVALVTIEGKGDALAEYRRYRAVFENAGWNPDEDSAEVTAFTERVADRIRAAMPGTLVVVKGPLTLTVGALQANLDRIHAFCARDAGQCNVEIDHYVAGIDEAARQADAPASREALRLVVRTSRYVQALAGEAHSMDNGIDARPLTEGLLTLPAIDGAATIQIVTRSVGRKLQLSSEEIWKLGEANLRGALKPLMQVATPVGKSAIGQVAPDAYASGRLALLDTWAPLAQAQGGTLIVGAPSNDQLLFIGDDSPVAIDALRTRVSEAMKHAPNPLTDLLLRWTAGGWQVVH